MQFVPKYCILKKHRSILYENSQSLSLISKLFDNDGGISWSTNMLMTIQPNLHIAYSCCES